MILSQAEHLTKCKAESAKDTVYCIMDAIMTPTVAKEINWLGKGGKKSFKDMKFLVDIIYGKFFFCFVFEARMRGGMEPQF